MASVQPHGGASGHDLQYVMTGLPAWEHGQPGQVGNEAALTIANSAGVKARHPALSAPLEALLRRQCNRLAAAHGLGPSAQRLAIHHPAPLRTGSPMAWRTACGHSYTREVCATSHRPVAWPQLMDKGM